MIDPNKVIDDAQHLLKKAVNVLEEEIAAGILAAKKMEKKVIDVDEVRDENPEDLMSRIRRDTHDAIDLLLDAFTALTRHFRTLTETLNKAGATAAQQTGGNGHSNGKEQAPTNEKSSGNGRSNGNNHSKTSQAQSNPTFGPTVIRATKPAKPGTTIEVPMSLSNDSKDEKVTIKLNRSELIGAGGSKIGARNIRLAPSAFTLDPLQKKEVLIKINVPGSCKEGVYSGLIQDDSNPDIRVILTIQIGKTKK